MKKYRQLIVLMFLIILFPINVKALCDYNDIARLKYISNNVTFSKDYIEKNNQVNFSITLTNLHPEIYVKDVTNNKEYHYTETSSNSKEITINNFSSGITARFEFYAANQECTDDILLIKYVILPPYNQYYDDPLCEGVENYSLCKKWVRTDLSYDNFKRSIKAYKNKKTENSTEEEPAVKTNAYDLIARFLQDYYIYILISIALISLLIIYIKRGKNTFDL